jgi:hypothetical protein
MPLVRTTPGPGQPIHRVWGSKKNVLYPEAVIVSTSALNPWRERRGARYPVGRFGHRAGAANPGFWRPDEGQGSG